MKDGIVGWRMGGCNNNLHEKCHSKDFQLNVFNYPPTSNLSGIIRTLRNRLPTNYIGVHLRYRDDVDWVDDDEIAFQCSGKMSGTTEVLDMIRRGHLNM